VKVPLVLQVIITIIGAFLSVILTKFLITNGRAIAENGRAIAENGRAIAETNAETRKAIAETSAETRKAIAETSAESRRRFKEVLERFDERTALIARLIVAKGEERKELMERLA